MTPLGMVGGRGAVSEDCRTVSPTELRHPENCVSCRDMWQPFVMPGHPDDGKLFACGIMVENEEAGCYSFHCPYRKPIVAPVIDAEQMNKSLRAVERLKERKRPVIVSGPPKESPHPWLDPVMERAVFEGQLVEKLCGICPDCTDCGIAGDPNAMYRCAKLRGAIGR